MSVSAAGMTIRDDRRTSAVRVTVRVFGMVLRPPQGALTSPWIRTDQVAAAPETASTIPATLSRHPRTAASGFDP
jgi:hypothetical protein